VEVWYTSNLQLLRLGEERKKEEEEETTGQKYKGCHINNNNLMYEVHSVREILNLFITEIDYLLFC